MIKNYLFQKSKTRIAEAQDYWSRMTGTIEMTSNEEEVEIFIRYHWCSLYGFVIIGVLSMDSLETTNYLKC